MKTTVANLFPDSFKNSYKQILSKTGQSQNKIAMKFGYKTVKSVLSYSTLCK